MTRILFFSDLHLHRHRKSDERLHDCLKVLEWVFSVAEENNIEDLVFGGDLFHDREKIDVMTYHLTFDILSKRVNNNRRLWLLLGNHDLWYHDKWDINSVRPMSAIEGLTVIDKPSTLKIGDNFIDFLPYTHHPIEHLDDLRPKREGRKTLVAHLAIDNAILNFMHGVRSSLDDVEHDGEMIKVDSSVLHGWDHVFLGHYHGQQKLGDNIEYIGSPLQLSFGEAFQHKHVILFNQEDGSKEYIRNKFSPQHFIIKESEIYDFDITNNFIRINVDDCAGNTVTELRHGLKKQNPASLEIRPVDKPVAEHVIHDAKAILSQEDQMIDEYVNQVDTGDLDKKELIEIGKMIRRDCA